MIYRYWFQASSLLSGFSGSRAAMVFVERNQGPLLALSIVLAGLLAGCGGESAPAPDLVLYNATVYTADADSSVAEAVAIRGDRFVAVGSTDEVRALAGPETEVRDLGGRAVIPGLGDDHIHDVGGRIDGVDLSDARSMDELLSAIAEAAEEQEAGELIVTQGDWHEGQLEEQRLPFRDDLDQAAPDNPVVVIRGGHELILNSAALEHYGIDRSTETPEGGRIGQYDDGRLNGELVDTATQLVELPDLGPQTLEGRMEQMAEDHRILNRLGVTYIRYAAVGNEKWRTLQEMHEGGDLTLRVGALRRPDDRAEFRLGQDTTGAVLDSILASWDVEPGQGDSMLKVAGFKLAVDGGFEGGLMREPYEEPYGEDGRYYGLQDFRTDAFVQTARELSRRGWRAATHAVGDSAMDVVLRGYRAADSVSSIDGRRWAVEHAFIPREGHFTDMRDLGVMASLQNHLYLAAPSLVKYWGQERAERTTPVRLFLDNDIRTALGTDASTIPHNPFWMFYHFATRGTITEGTMGEEFAISRNEVLRAATWGNAYLAFAEEERGTIEEGKLADLAVLSRDVMQIPADRIEGTRSLLTVVGGEIVYEAEELSGAGGQAGN